MADKLTVTGDFDAACRRAKIQSVFSTLRWKNPNLLSFYEVTKLIKPDAEFYKGIQTIPVKNIIGSESRYQDFSSAFYPKSHLLQRRWESIDAAQMDDVILPPISVYKLGDWYFVRDGNHRVSVARSTGQVYIDAEVVELSTKIPLEEGMTLNELKKRVVSYERAKFLEQYNPTYLPMDKIVFTTPGSYPEMVNHILVHKYYINQNIDHEISFQEGAESWFKNVYTPIVQAVDHEHLQSLYPGCTEADIYMWLVRKWDEKKRKDSKISEEAVAKEIKETEEKNKFKHWWEYLKQKLSRK